MMSCIEYFRMERHRNSQKPSNLWTQVEKMDPTEYSNIT